MFLGFLIVVSVTALAVMVVALLRPPKRKEEPLTEKPSAPPPTLRSAAPPPSYRRMGDYGPSSYDGAHYPAIKPVPKPAQPTKASGTPSFNDRQARKPVDSEPSLYGHTFTSPFESAVSNPISFDSSPSPDPTPDPPSFSGGGGDFGGGGSDNSGSSSGDW